MEVKRDERARPNPNGSFLRLHLTLEEFFAGRDIDIPSMLDHTEGFDSHEQTIFTIKDQGSGVQESHFRFADVPIFQ